MSEKTCAERVNDHWKSVQEDLTRYANDGEVYENGHEDGASPFWEYALSFDYVAPGTFTDQKEGYWRYLMSCGGPGDEIRFFGDVHGTFHRAEYWFLDWFDGAKLDVTKEPCIEWLWQMHFDTELVQSTYNAAMEE